MKRKKRIDRNGPEERLLRKIFNAPIKKSYRERWKERKRKKVEFPPWQSGPGYPPDGRIELGK